ncbi:hypothetical protein [Hydrogenispora ethanolica]|uniref:hypothetical protein n=1 Tax=Hydrogenispora ethanolica TaxID=1082276 RepID=UPI001042C2B2|nr:hypothetical protein [Hydrogenispora ethanolica]
MVSFLNILGIIILFTGIIASANVGSGIDSSVFSEFPIARLFRDTISLAYFIGGFLSSMIFFALANITDKQNQIKENILKLTSKMNILLENRVEDIEKKISD